MLTKCTDGSWNNGNGIFYGNRGGTVKFFVVSSDNDRIRRNNPTPGAFLDRIDPTMSQV